MKTQNTLENKAKFFALYFGQRILRYNNWSDEANNKEVGSFVYDLYNENTFLELKPLSQISDEDAEYCIGKMECSLRINDPNHGDYGMSPSSIFINSIIGHNSFYIDRRESDYLRLNGYAIKWVDLKIEDLIEYGWIKLKEI